LFLFIVTVLIFFTAGLLPLRLERVISLGAYRIPQETGLLIPSGKRAPKTCGYYAVEAI
jgi:hypothetical protein